MKLPRDLSGRDLAKALERLGYQVTRQTASHIRLTRYEGGAHHVTIPDHDVLKVGTLSSILRAVGDHGNLTRDELLEQLFG